MRGKKVPRNRSPMSFCINFDTWRSICRHQLANRPLFDCVVTYVRIAELQTALLKIGRMVNKLSSWGYFGTIFPRFASMKLTLGILLLYSSTWIDRHTTCLYRFCGCRVIKLVILAGKSPLRVFPIFGNFEVKERVCSTEMRRFIYCWRKSVERLGSY